VAHAEGRGGLALGRPLGQCRLRARLVRRPGNTGPASTTPATLPAFANEQRAAETGFRVGQQVFHTKFGEGTITALEGGGTDAKAQVKFKRHGEKWLALAVAKLQAVE